MRRYLTSGGEAGVNRVKFHETGISLPAAKPEWIGSSFRIVKEDIMRTLISTAVIAIVVMGAPSVSRAQETPTSTTKQAAGDVEQMRGLIDQLTSENERLRGKVAELKRQLRNQSIRDRMTQEEQRAENLEEQLFSIAKEESNLQGQLEEVNEQLRPERLEQLQIMGSLRPEEVRESTRLRLTNQQSRIQAQLQLLEQNRNRIHSSISVTDILIQNLRMQMQAAALQ